MLLKDKLLSLNIVNNNEYLDKYIEIIEANRHTKKEKFKTQKHHIIPRYYFRDNNLKVDNSPDNVVNLLYKDHILAHYYLCLCSKTDRQIYQNFIIIRFVFNNRWLETKGFDLNILDKYQSLYEQSKLYQSELELGKHIKPASEERKQKISVANSGRKHIYKDGTTITVKQEDLNKYLNQGWKLGNPKLSVSKKGKESPKKGKPTGRPSWNKGLTKDTDTRVRKISLVNKRNTKLRKKVYCITTDEIFNSVTEAAEKLNLKKTSISNCCLGVRNSCYGYKFTYIIPGDR